MNGFRYSGHAGAVLFAALFAVASIGGCSGYGGASAGNTPAPKQTVAVVRPRVSMVLVSQPPEPALADHLGIHVYAPQFTVNETYTTRVEKTVNGRYFAMPDPPAEWSVWAVPHYDLVPDRLVFTFTIDNGRQTVFHGGTPTVAIDRNGETIFTESSLKPTVLPGHSRQFAVTGPPLSQLGDSTGTLEFGIYELDVSGRMTNLIWTYRLDIRRQPAEEEQRLLLRTSDQSEADSWQGRKLSPTEVAHQAGQ